LNFREDLAVFSEILLYTSFTRFETVTNTLWIRTFVL
jgi:hypothetical protein